MPRGHYQRASQSGPFVDPTYTPSEPANDTYGLSCPIAANLAYSWSLHDVDDAKLQLWHPNFGRTYDIARRAAKIFRTNISKVKFDSYYD